MKTAHDLGREVVGGRPEAAAGEDQVHARVGHEPQRRLDVRRPVAHDHRQREVDAEIAQAVGQPGAVAVADAAGEHLGPGDDDARAGAHVQVGWRSGASGRRPPSFVIE